MRLIYIDRLGDKKLPNVESPIACTHGHGHILTQRSLPLFPCVQEGHSNKVSISPTVMALGQCRQNFINCESSSGKQSIRSCTWRDVMIERAMWIASGSHSGLVLMMMERDAPKRLHCIRYHAHSRKHRHSSAYFSRRCIAQKK